MVSQHVRGRSAYLNSITLIFVHLEIYGKIFSHILYSLELSTFHWKMLHLAFGGTGFLFDLREWHFLMWSTWSAALNKDGCREEVGIEETFKIKHQC